MQDRYDTVLIGGSGFIGTHLSHYLTESGERVLSISRHLPDQPIPGIDSVAIDFSDPTSAKEFSLPSCQSVIILIGQVGPGFDPNKDREALSAVISVINAYGGSLKVLYASTALVYGNCEAPAHESDPLRPIEPYAVHKAENESLLKKSIDPRHSLAILRLSNIFGDIRSRGFISLLVRSLQEPGRSIGKFIVNGDGKQERDYLFIDDLVAAFLAVKSRLTGSDVINISSGESRTLLSVIEAVRQVSGKQVDFDLNNQPINEAQVIRVSNKHLAEVYGFTPQLSFKEGVAEMWQRSSRTV